MPRSSSSDGFRTKIYRPSYDKRREGSYPRTLEPSDERIRCQTGFPARMSGIESTSSTASTPTWPSDKYNPFNGAVDYRKGRYDGKKHEYPDSSRIEKDYQAYKRLGREAASLKGTYEDYVKDQRPSRRDWDEQRHMYRGYAPINLTPNAHVNASERAGMAATHCVRVADARDDHRINYLGYAGRKEAENHRSEAAHWRQAGKKLREKQAKHDRWARSP